MLGYLSADIICSERRTVFRERNLRKTMSFEEQIMSKNKYPSIFSCQMEAIVFIILKIFFAAHTVLKIGEYSWIFPSWGTFGHVMCLGQSRMSKNIWWIVISDIPQFYLGNIWSCDMFRTIMHKRNYFRDYNRWYQQQHDKIHILSWIIMDMIVVSYHLFGYQVLIVPSHFLPFLFLLCFLTEQNRLFLKP